MWEALSEQRNSEEASTKRRSFLASIGALALLPAGVSADNGDEVSSKAVEEPEDILENMRLSQDAQLIIGKLRRKGYSPDFGNASVTKVKIGNDTGYETVSLPFEGTGPEVLGYISYGQV